MRTGAIPRKRTWTRAASLGVLAALALLITMLVLPPTPPSARATVPGVDPSALFWDTANRSYYGAYNTPIFTSTNVDGQTTFAYCVDPTTTVPDAGAYQTIPVEDFNPAMARETRAALWFGYGGPGFDPSMWPSVWDDGSPMDAANYYAATHVILSYTTMQDLRYAYYNAGSDFIGYAAGTFLGYNLYGRVINDNSTMFQMFARANEVPDDYTCYYLDCGEEDWIQYTIGQDPYVPMGSLALQKSSSNSTVTAGNPCYALEGARFGIYADAACEQLEATAVTDASGSAFVQELRAGSHWVKELDPPPGYALNATAQEIQVRSGETTTLGIANTPQVDYLPIVAYKSSTEPAGQGLEGAEFAVSYYAGLYDLASLPAAPTRTWTLRTDANGEARLGEAWLVSGDEFYRGSDGRPALPLGTVLIQETRAPAGYLMGDEGPLVRRIEGSGAAESVSCYAAPTVLNTPARGGVSIQKADAETRLASPQGNASLENAEFAVVALDAIVMNGTVCEPGSTVATLVTDARGFASTGPDALPCGPYRIEESRAPQGYLPSTDTWTVRIEVPNRVIAVGDLGGLALISAEAPTAPTLEAIDSLAEPTEEGLQTHASMSLLSGLAGYVAPLFFGPSIAYAEGADGPVVPEQVIRGGLRVQKIDAELGSAQAQGIASLAGARFSIVNASGHAVVVGGTAFAPGTEVTVITTDENGIAQTGAHDLPFGTYSVVEVEAPPGYELGDPSPLSVEVHEDGVVHDAPASFTNPVIRGGLSLVKVDFDTGSSEPQGAASLAGAEFEIANAGPGPVVVGGKAYAPGDVVMTIVTDEQGRASTGDHDLPYGLYTVFEATPPQGYLAEESKRTVRVTQQGTCTPLASPVRENVQRGGFGLRKLDADTGQDEPQGNATLAGAVYHIVNANEHPVVVHGEAYEPGAVVMAIETDEHGWAQTESHSLPYGTYTVLEATAPEGYHRGLVDNLGQQAEEGASLAVTVDSEWFWQTYEQELRDHVIRGGISLAKIDVDLGGQAQGQATFEGARFAIENASAHAVVVNGTSYAPGETVMVLTTDESGRAATGPRELPYGSYLVRETHAPTGYLVNDTSWEAQIQTDGLMVAIGETSERDPVAEAPATGGLFDGFIALFSPTSATAQEASEEPLPEGGKPWVPEQVIRGGVEVFKRDAENADGAAQGDASLAGARFAVTSLNDHGVWVAGNVYYKGEVVMTLTTDEHGRAASGERDLPYGTYAVEEVAPPAGYLAPEPAQVETFSVEEDGCLVSFERPFFNKPARGGISIQKVDAETSSPVPLGSARLDGAVFSITNASRHAVMHEGATFEPGEVIMSITTNAEGRAATADRALPIGTYAVEEITPPEGYVLGSGGTSYVSILEEGAVATCSFPFANRVARGDIEGVKVEDGTQRRMGGVAFLVTSLTTGERHVIVSGEDGTLTTSASTVPHTSNTNANDAALDERGSVVDESKLSAANGVWFHGSTSTITEPNDEAGALPFDRYRLDELPTAANYGHALVSFTVSIRQDGHVVPVGTINNAMIHLETTAHISAPGQDEAPAVGSATVTDVVSYANLTPGLSYELHGALMDRTEGTPLLDEEGDAISATCQFTPEEGSGAVELSFEVDAGRLEGRQAVVFERLYLDGTEVASHEDIADDGQTVSFVSISTTAVGVISGLHEEQATTKTGIVDSVTYRGLVPGREYRIEGALMDRATGDPLTNPDGSPIEAGRTFVAESCSGVATLPFVFDATDHVGRTAVAFERLYRDEREIANHQDLLDDAQAVRLVSLSTSAADKASGSRIGTAAPEATVVDVVDYGGLEVGAQYCLVGLLMDKESRTPLVGPNGKELSATTALVPQTPDGSVVLEFDLDASALANSATVVFEILMRDNTVVASHIDIDDEAQTVRWTSPMPIPESGDRTARPESLLAVAGAAACMAVAGALAARAALQRPTSTRKA